jgi:hypothetical protein
MPGYRSTNLRWRKTFVRRRYRPCESGDRRLYPVERLEILLRSGLLGQAQVTKVDGSDSREGTPDR